MNSDKRSGISHSNDNDVAVNESAKSAGAGGIPISTANLNFFLDLILKEFLMPI